MQWIPKEVTGADQNNKFYITGTCPSCNSYGKHEKIDNDMALCIFCNKSFNRMKIKENTYNKWDEKHQQWVKVVDGVEVENVKTNAPSTKPAKVKIRKKVKLPSNVEFDFGSFKMQLTWLEQRNNFDELNKHVGVLSTICNNIKLLSFITLDNKEKVTFDCMIGFSKSDWSKMKKNVFVPYMKRQENVEYIKEVVSFRIANSMNRGF